MLPILSLAEIRDNLLRDIRNQLPDAAVDVDSDFYVRATSVASAIEGLYQHQARIERQIFPDTADREYLELHARVRGLTRKPAVAAQGKVKLTGTPGASVGTGLIGKWGDQVYVSTQGGVIGEDGTLMIPMTASVPGVDGNRLAGVAIELSAAPMGVSSQALCQSMTGGVAEESDAALLARLLDLIRRPPAGGNKYDYRRWALEVPGVTAAYVYPLRRGLGTVDVVITAGDGMPSEATLAAVQAHIDAVRPVTASSSRVMAATARVVDVEVRVQLAGLTLEVARGRITELIGKHFALLAPGDALIKSQLEGLVTSLAGVTDRVVRQPASNVLPTVDAAKVEWCRLGTVTVGAM